MKKMSYFIVCLLIFSGCEESAVQRAPEEQFSARARSILTESLTHQDPYIRTNAIEAVARSRSMGLMPLVSRMLTDQTVPVRFAAALAIGDTQYSQALNDIIETLEDPDKNVQIAASYALYKMGRRDYWKPLLVSVQSKDLTLRANAAALLGKAGNKEAIEQLYQSMRAEDSDHRVKLNCAEAIASLQDEEIFNNLWTLLISKFAEYKITGLRAMGALGTPTARDVLITMLDDELMEVRLIAAGELGALGDTTGQQQVLRVFTTQLPAGLKKEDVERIKVLAVISIGQIRTRKLAAYLPDLLNDPSQRVRIAAAQAVLQYKLQK